MTFCKESTADAVAALRFLAAEMNCTPTRQNLDGFAEACFDDNSVEELIEALKMRAADSADCESWGITPTQWRLAIKGALEFRIYLAIEDIGGKEG